MQGERWAGGNVGTDPAETGAPSQHGYPEFDGGAAPSEPTFMSTKSQSSQQGCNNSMLTHRQFPHKLTGFFLNARAPHGPQLPTDAQAKAVGEELRARSQLPSYIKGVLESLPEGTHPMTQFSTLVLALQVQLRVCVRVCLRVCV